MRREISFGVGFSLSFHLFLILILFLTPGYVFAVNDYHLMLVPQMVREALPSAIIGFFLHVAFPSSEIFRCLAIREQL